ncbi:acriflavine resistance protein B [Roseococcus sp. SYP-B2431]|uniref:efflux RND transporter permease subunit n=1 Tax=Roseococcus sp. SYP-B2431 TaxID=2496640 RepID=UPI001039B0B9|nr:efflux RND transporter permease subunit [Roseococcus sp. SYP-B2431]TCH98201.1 acriflavine resistance protein B [Roseococcus sp. SYP-B2431]
MSISEPFIRRPIATVMLSVGLALAGMVAYFGLPVAPLPRMDLPTIVVSASQPGADPAVMASSVAAPLERRLGAIAGVSEMTSRSSLGSTSVVVQFDLNRSVSDAAKDVQAAINAAGTDLPAGLPNPPTFRKANPADAPILILAVTSDTLAPGAVYDAVDSIVSPRIARIDGVAQVQVTGAEQPAIRIQVDPAAAASAGISLENIRSTVTRSNITQPTGLIDGTEQGGAISINDRIDQAQDYANLILRAQDGAIMRLSHIAHVELGVRDRRQGGSYNGRPAVIAVIYKQPDANVIEVVDNIQKLLPDLQRWLPNGVHVHTIRDRSETIRASVEEVQFTLVISIVLVVLVVAAFLRRRAAVFAAAISVPLSLLGTLAVMWLLGYSLDNLSLMALTISVGFVVDDAIVMIENMTRLREKGMPAMEAALEGARQIGFTVVSITLSLIAVFIPLLFMPGIVGRMFREFSVTLAVAVAFSAVISLTVTPMVAARMASGVERRPGWFGRAFEWVMAATIEGYMASLKVVLRFRAIMLLFTVSLVGLTVWLYIIVPKDFFPAQDTGLIAGTVQAAPDTSFQTMMGLQQRAVDIIMADPGVASLGVSVGGGGGGSGSTARMFISLKPESERPGVTANDIINRLRGPLNRIPGAQTFMRSVQDINVGGRAGNASFQYALLAPDLDELQTWSERLVRQLRTVPQLADVSSDQERAGLVSRLVVDRDAAARLGLSIQAINQTLNNAFAQRQVSVIYRTRNQYRVIMEIDPRLTEDPRQLDDIYVSGSGGQVPLSAVTRLERSSAPLSIMHQGQFPASTITFNLAPGVALGEAAALVEQAQRAIGMPATVRGEFAGNARVFRSFQTGQTLLILAALVSIYLVLGILYESLIHPLTIISTLPTAGIGALLALILTNTPFTVIALIGVILLMGIVKKNAIMMVDFALQHEREGGEPGEQAILEACRERFRPILMTTLAALLGAIPLAIGTGPGSELRQPLGIAIIGGLALSQLLTLYTTPVVYLALESLAGGKRERIAAPPLPAE